MAAAISYINWGLGLVGAAIYAVILAKVRDDLDYGYLIAAAYSGTRPGIVGSLSVTAPLLMNTPEHFMVDQIGIIYLSQTIFSPMHLFVVLGSLLAFLVLFWAMKPPEEEVESVPDEKLDALLPERPDVATDGGEDRYISDRLNESLVFTAFVVIFAGSYIVWHFATQGFIEGLNLNSMNFTLLIIGIALHGGLVNYVRAVENAVEAAAPIILQFPFYGGIQGLFLGSGLALLLVNSIVDLSGPATYPLAVFLGTGILNVFVPSACGQYIVTAEILLGAGTELGVSDPVIISAYTFGDIWTNMIQPFFALPLIAIAGLPVSDI